VIAGQGTVSIEFVEQVREMIGADLDAVVIPVGGGGLAAGNTIALRGLLGNKVKVGTSLNFMYRFIIQYISSMYAVYL
jgi:threonine dehydratase